MISNWVSVMLAVTAIWLCLCVVVVVLLNRNDKKYGSKLKD